MFLHSPFFSAISSSHWTVFKSETIYVVLCASVSYIKLYAKNIKMLCYNLCLYCLCHSVAVDVLNDVICFLFSDC